MRITLRLVVALLVTAALLAAGFTFLEIRSERERLAHDLEGRARILAESLEEPLAEALALQELDRLHRLVTRFGNRQRLSALAVYDSTGASIAATPGLSSWRFGAHEQAGAAASQNRSIAAFQRDGAASVHVFTAPLHHAGRTIGAVVLFHDASYIDARLTRIWRDRFLLLLIQAVVITLTTILVVRWSITGPIAKIAEWLKGLRLGDADRPLALPRSGVIGPLAAEVVHLAQSLVTARAAAEEEARLRARQQAVWTPERLREHVREELGGRALYVVSNREPYMHVRNGRVIECRVPAGGVVTALDPVLRACGGIWIASGSGDADRDVTGPDARLPVPPQEPAYTLRRIWLSKEQEEGFYYGFSNEGLWPLSHTIHVRPEFRLRDWVEYREVNELFAETLLDELKAESEPLVLVQDCHFALLPALIKRQRADARVALFWHIPWPNPEAFEICPWKQEILQGLLGADLIGFHLQYHCNNYLATVERLVEARVDWAEFTVERGGHVTRVRPFPISVPFPAPASSAGGERERLLHDLGITCRWLGVGVERIDYTKGIPERFLAIERLLERHPEFIGQFTFVELGAPSRTHIKRYHDLVAEVEQLAARINWRFETKRWKPIVFLKAQHGHDTIRQFYRAADVCLVTSLHDGMNLVAKEFVAARDDEDGVLILSRFAGASQELTDALVVNPYDIEETTTALVQALRMTPQERVARMRRLRQVVREHNVYRWGAELVRGLARLGPVAPAPEEERMPALGASRP